MPSESKTKEKPYRLVSRERYPESMIVTVGNVEIGGEGLVVMAGPCSVEEEGTTIEIARQVKKAGAQVFRAGAYKPRTSPYSFQGLGEEGLKILRKVREETGMPVVTEVMDARDIGKVGKVADILQIGARNMANFALLDEMGKIDKPVLLKRGISSTVEEWLLAAERIAKAGNGKVILCERGIRTFETYSRNTLDVNAIAAAKRESCLPVIADSSHGTGVRELVLPASRAAVAAGADGLLIEAHIDPEKAWSDKQQTVSIRELERIISACRSIRGSL